MFGNMNSGSKGFNPESVRGELPGHSGLQASIIEMVQNLDASALQGLYQALNSGPNNTASVTRAAQISRAAAATSTTYTEQQRVEKLESIRTPENSLFIDEAITSGESPESAALRIIKASLAADDIAAEINRIYDSRQPKMPRNHDMQSKTGDPSVDDLVAEIHKLSNQRHD